MRQDVKMAWIMKPEPLKRMQELMARSLAGDVTDEEWTEIVTEINNNPDNWEPVQ